MAICRGQQDASITIDDKQRDYMRYLDNVMVAGGEDKPQRHLMNTAVQKLLDKHSGANAALYGDLGYLVLQQELLSGSSHFSFIQEHGCSHSRQSLRCVPRQSNLS